MQLGAHEWNSPQTPDAMIGSGSDTGNEAREKEAEAELLALPFFQPGEKGFAPFEIAKEDYVRRKSNIVSDKDINYQYKTAHEKMPEGTVREARDKALELLKVFDKQKGAAKFSEHLLHRLASLGAEEQEAYIRGYMDFMQDSAIALYINEYSQKYNAEDPLERVARIPHLELIMQAQLERAFEDDAVKGPTAHLLLQLAEDLQKTGVDVFSGMELEDLEMHSENDAEGILISKSEVLQKVLALKQQQPQKLAA